MSNLLLDTIGGLMKGDTLATLTSLIGAGSEGATKKGIAAGSSALLASLAQTATTPDGVANIQKALSGISPSLTDNLAGFLQNPGAINGAGIVQQLLGSNAAPVGEKVAKASGLTPDAIGRLLPVLTPIVLGTAGKAIQSQGLGVQDLPKFFADQAGFTKTLTPGLMGFLETIDANDDGSILDDLGRLTDRLFGGNK
jgi:hypothetical protein